MATSLDTCEKNSQAAHSLCEQGRYEEALRTFQGVLRIKKIKLGSEHHDTLETQTNIGRVLYLQGQTDEALQISNKVYEVQKRSNPEHPSTLVTRNNIAMMLIDKKKYEEALQILREVLKVYERTGCKTSIIRQNIAGVLHKLGRYQEALDGYSEVYTIFERELGKDHRDTLILKNNMALLFADLKNYERAQQIVQEVYEVKKRTLGVKHPSTLITQDNMAFMLLKQNRLREALEHFENVYRYRVEVLGLENTDTIRTRTEIARIFCETGKLEEAFLIRKDIESRSSSNLHFEFVDIAKKLYDEGKPKEALRLFTKICDNMSVTADSRPGYLILQYNIANILEDLNRYEESLKIFKQVYNGRVDVLGPDHDFTLDAWQRIATVLEKLGKYSEALDNLQKIKERKISVLGPEHQSVLDTKMKLASLLSVMGNYEGAANITKEILQTEKGKTPENPETLMMQLTAVECLRHSGKYTEALEMLYKILERQRNAGSPVSDTLKTRSSIVFFLDKKGNHDEALQICEEVYEEKKLLLGPEHPDTLNDRNTIGSILTSLGRPKEALELLCNVYEILKKNFGKEHLDTLTTQHNIAAALSDLGRHKEALDMYQEVLDVQQKVLPHNSYFVITKIRIADELKTLNKLDEALHILTEIYENQKSVPLNPDTLTTRHSIAKVFEKKGNYCKASEILEDVIEKRSEILGSEHIKTLTSQNDLAIMLLEQNKLNEALNIFEDIYEILKGQNDHAEKSSERHLDHPLTVGVKNNIAAVYCQLGKYEKALEIFKEIYENRKEILGCESSACLTVQHSIAAVLAYLKKYNEALAQYYDVHRKSSKSLGRNHPLTMQSLKSMEQVESLVPKPSLFVAVRKNDVNQVRDFIVRGGDANAKDVFGTTLLHMAAENGNIEMVKLLLEHGASYNPRNEEGHTPSFFTEDEECKRLFSSIDAAFHAAKIRDIDILKRSVRKEFLINVKDDVGSTVLHWACNRNDVSIVNFLLIEGADPTSVTNKGNSALHIACSKRSLNIADALIKHVKEHYPAKIVDYVNGKTAIKMTTPLHVAAGNGDSEIIKLLVNNGGDLKAKNSDGKMPLDLAPKNVDLLSVFKEISEM